MGWSHSFLRPDEKIFFEGNVSKKHRSMAAGMIIAGTTGIASSITSGRLFLTDKRLVFAKHIFLLFGTKVIEEITLRMIDSVTDVPDKLYSYIKIDTKDEKSHLFDVAPIKDEKSNILMPPQAKEKWIKKINEAIQSSN